MEGETSEATSFVEVPFGEDFSKDQPKGHVVGSRSTGGVVRLGCDAENQITIDNGIMRFRPLVTPGWGREGISYGPFKREPGLTFAISMTNGHNASQGSAYFESFPKRVARWMVGPNADSVFLRAFEWVRGPRKSGTLRRLRWWSAISPRAYKHPFFNQNLLVGWLTNVTPNSLDDDGSYFVMNSAEENNGELWANVCGQFLAAIRNVKNIRLVFLVTLREKGAVYYVSAIDGSQGFGSYPYMRPLAIDPYGSDPSLYAAVHQCALGQIGWRSETLIHDLQVTQCSSLASPFGTAHVSDNMLRSYNQTAPRISPEWRIEAGELLRTEFGASAKTDGKTLVTNDPGFASGLLHALITLNDGDAEVGLVWRMTDAANYGVLSVSRNGCKLQKIENGVVSIVSETGEHSLTVKTEHSLQIIDGFGQIGCYLDGELLFEVPFDDIDFADGTGVGFLFNGPAQSSKVRNFEAHPREVELPIRMSSPSFKRREGEQILLADKFLGDVAELGGRKPDVGESHWERTLGRGHFVLTGGEGLRVTGTSHKPHPNRTLYTLRWSHDRFCDLEVSVIPPGCGSGEEQRTRAGIVFWQDPRNYLTISPWQNDSYPGSSISVFPKRHGFEELYDAVWTNVGDAISWARPFNLRCQFDGDEFLILLNGEPIMERALSDLYPTDPPLSIKRVGLATNWEWGNDTGSVYRNFIARY